MKAHVSGAALITGGAHRIGKACALFLSKKQYKIALHYNHSKEAAEDVGHIIKSNGGECSLFPCDLSNSAAVAAVIPEVFKVFPDCRLLINNASIFERINFLETDEATFDRYFNINFKAPFFLSQHFARQCKEGHIINLLDTKIVRSHSHYFIYLLTKKILFEFTKMAAVELGPGIRVNGICPGLILPSSGAREEAFQRMAAKIPLQNAGNIDSITSALGFLLENSFVTGECIFVDGGEHLV